MAPVRHGKGRIGRALQPGLPAMRPWKVLTASLLLTAPPWVSVFREKVELPSGRVLDDFYRVVMPDFVAVVAVTPGRELVLVRGYKHGLGRVSVSPPGGLVELGESPLRAAQRELLEETGYAAPDWRCLGQFVVDGNRHCGRAHFFLARNASQVAEGKTDDAEEAQVELMSVPRVVRAVRRGEVGLLGSLSAISLALVLGLD